MNARRRWRVLSGSSIGSFIRSYRSSNSEVQTEATDTSRPGPVYSRGLAFDYVEPHRKSCGGSFESGLAAQVIKNGFLDPSIANYGHSSFS